MIKCLECHKEYRKLTKAHFRKHGITTEEYLSKYPNAKLNCEEYLKRASEASSNYFKTLSSEDWKKRTYKRTKNHKDAFIKRTLHARNEKWDEIYGKGSTRNKKISNAKKDFWDGLTFNERSEMNKKSTQTQRERMGEENFRNLMRRNGIEGYKAAIRKGKNKTASTFEIEMYSYIESKGFRYIPQYNINGWFYDCYVPELNLLFEFDGDFWHPLTEDDCKYDFQFKRLHTDKMKNKVAEDAGYNLIRIRHSEKEKMKEIL